MNNLLTYILWGLLLVLAWFKYKELKSTKERREEIKHISPDFFNQKRAKMLPKDYIKWLKKFYTLLGVDALECKEKGHKVESHMMDALLLTEKEIEDLNAKMGTQINLGEKISEEFKNWN